MTRHPVSGRHSHFLISVSPLHQIPPPSMATSLVRSGLPLLALSSTQPPHTAPPFSHSHRFPSSPPPSGPLPSPRPLPVPFPLLTSFHLRFPQYPVPINIHHAGKYTTDVNLCLIGRRQLWHLRPPRMVLYNPGSHFCHPLMPHPFTANSQETVILYVPSSSSFSLLIQYLFSSASSSYPPLVPHLTRAFTFLIFISYSPQLYALRFVPLVSIWDPPCPPFAYISSAKHLDGGGPRAEALSKKKSDLRAS